MIPRPVSTQEFDVAATSIFTPSDLMLWLAVKFGTFELGLHDFAPNEPLNPDQRLSITLVSEESLRFELVDVE